MRNVLLIGMLCMVLVGVGGCFVSVKEGCHCKKLASEPVIDPTIAEIDAVQTLASESARLNVLRAIAQRPGLSPEARVRLIEATRMLASESSREEVLMNLAKNPPIPPEPMPVPSHEPYEDEEDD